MEQFRIEVICEDCGRPGAKKQQATERTRNGYQVKKTVVHNKCECGGEIKPQYT